MINNELRATPGYTNFVVSEQKTLNSGGEFIQGSSYYKRYYSLMSAEIYFGDTWIEDIESINWTVQRKQMPLFGYNSYIWDELALGSRMIQGNFTVNFTSPNYIKKAISNQLKLESTKTITYSNGIMATPHEYEFSVNNAHDSIWKEVCDIDIIFGEKEKIGGVPCHIILKDCNISAEAMQTAATNGVLKEQYGFIARDFVVIE